MKYHQRTTNPTPLSTLMSLLLLATLVSLAASRATSGSCMPGYNCKLPNCRCAYDRSTPGNIPQKYTPQMIMVTFTYAVNEANVNQYQSLFAGLTNPNRCPAVGTFYVQEKWTDMKVVKRLSDYGHEIGVTSTDGTPPQGYWDWMYGLGETRRAEVNAGVPLGSIVGVRAPNLKVGGNDEFAALSYDHFLYDASCATGVGLTEEDHLWPFTYDFVPGIPCDIGEAPTKYFPGKWQFLVADLMSNGTRCATPQACPGISCSRDAFNLFYSRFIKHYDGSRTPFMMVITPDWAATDYKLEGTIKFLQYVNKAFPDTWIVSVRQALEWMRNPVPSSKSMNYAPWNCYP